MRITSKISRLKRGIVLTLFSGLLFAAGCGRAQYEMPYTVNPDVSAFRIVDIQEDHMKKWGDVLPFYRNVKEEGIVLWKAA